MPRILVYGFSGQLIGGIESFILNMNEYMSDACIFDYMIDGNICIHGDCIAQKGGKVHFIAPIRKSPLAYIRDMWRTLAECKKQGTRVLYVQLFAMVNILPMLLGRMQGYTVVLHAHNSGLQNNGTGYRFLHFLGKKITSIGRFVRLTNSSLSADFMFGRGKRAELIYNAVDVQRYAFDLNERVALREYYKVGDQNVVGFVGRLTLPKNPLFMLRVFHELLKICPTSQLWIVGEGSLKEDMEDLVEQLDLSKHVKWFGRRDDVETLMLGMDVLLQPSIFEGLGIVLIEAQAAGLPCVTSKDVVPDITRITEYIHYVPIDSSKVTWAKTVCQLLAEPIDRTGSSQLVTASSFNICSEAVRLEELLLNL